MNDTIRMKKEDIPELSVGLTYLVQAMGEATQKEIAERLVAINTKVNAGTLHRALEAMRAKKILSEGHREGQRIYRMAQLRWNCVIEVAHVTNITTLCEQLQSEEPGNYEAIINRVSNGAKERRTPPPAGWKNLRLTFRLLEPWLGGHPYDASKEDMELYCSSPTSIPKPDEKEPFLVFRRDNSGRITINRACVLGFLSTHLARAEKPDYMVKVFGCRNITFSPTNGELGLTKLPIQRAGSQFSHESSGAGMSWYECLQEGTVLQLDLTAPLVNFMTLDELRAWLSGALAMPHRSMSPARGKQFGAAELIDLTVID